MFKQPMTLDRLELATKCLYFVVNTTRGQLHIAQKKLFKINPILKHLNAKF